MTQKHELLPLRHPAASRCRSARACVGPADGFTLIELLVATAILVGGLAAVAQLLAVTVQLHQLGRTSAEATRLAQAKFEELMKLNFATAAAVQISPPAPDPLQQNVGNYFDVPVAGGYTRRWRVQAGPTAATRLVTVRVVPARADRLHFKPVEVTTLLRQW